ncbi:hypothetical protein AGMMS50268_02610 [Spirochaetia bacterium]|nr:hypothetical protein AGMMS50268_02610 [Spirochaetia bacterium]
MKNLKSLRIFVLTAALVCTSGVLLHAQTAPRSYYVSATGDDNNNGRSEAAPFRTLDKAVEAAKAGVIKTITVIGTIEDSFTTTHGKIFNKLEIRNTGTDEILITGKPDASEAEKAVFNSPVSIYNAKIRFTHIEMKVGGRELYFSNTEVTMGRGAVATSISLDRESSLIMTDNASVTGGLGIALNGSLTMTDNASVTGNNRNGINVSERAVFIMRDNAIITNNKEKGVSGQGDITLSGNAQISNNGKSGIEGRGKVILSDNAEISSNGGNGLIVTGGTVTVSGNVKINGNKGAGVYLERGTLNMNGGTITGNKAEYGAGVYLEKGTFSFTGGSITGNEAEFVGGGVYVKSGATYTAGGGYGKRQHRGRWRQ